MTHNNKINNSSPKPEIRITKPQTALLNSFPFGLMPFLGLIALLGYKLWPSWVNEIILFVLSVLSILAIASLFRQHQKILLLAWGYASVGGTVLWLLIFLGDWIWSPEETHDYTMFLVPVLLAIAGGVLLYLANRSTLAQAPSKE